MRTSDTHTCCQALSSGTVTTCFYDLSLSNLGFEYPIFRLRGERSNPLRHLRGNMSFEKSKNNIIHMEPILVFVNLFPYTITFARFWESILLIYLRVVQTKFFHLRLKTISNQSIIYISFYWTIYLVSSFLKIKCCIFENNVVHVCDVYVTFWLTNY